MAAVLQITDEPQAGLKKQNGLEVSDSYIERQPTLVLTFRGGTPKDHSERWQLVARRLNIEHIRFGLEQYSTVPPPGYTVFDDICTMTRLTCYEVNGSLWEELARLAHSG